MGVSSTAPAGFFASSALSPLAQASPVSVGLCALLFALPTRMFPAHFCYVLRFLLRLSPCYRRPRTAKAQHYAKKSFFSIGCNQRSIRTPPLPSLVKAEQSKKTFRLRCFAHALNRLKIRYRWRTVGVVAPCLPAFGGGGLPNGFPQVIYFTLVYAPAPLTLVGGAGV